MNVTIRQLRAFVAVAEHGQYTRAAAHIHITQAALSMLIRDLEHEVGVKVFNRHTRMVELTDAGRELLGMARRVLGDIQTTVEQAGDYAAYRRGRVTVASGTVLSAILITPFMRQFYDRYPGIKLQLRDVAEQDIYQSILNDDVDMGVGTKLDSHDEIQETPLFADHYVAVLHKDNPLGKRKTVPWAQLCKEPFIALSRSSPLRQDIDRHLALLKLRPNKIHEASFHTTVLAMVRNRLGSSILPTNSQYVPGASGLVFRPMGTPVLRRQTCVFQLSRRALSPAAQLFREELRGYIAQSQATQGV
ncbi:MAG TPA: LysR family transcriptional regulator [Pusillimonas sp.]|uniref:LysR family transcriptional regulator n=1 Tax=Pusillimonas sp. TaxID=3040095 RepID=UPI002CE2D91D|nr:LysR family transcriptional regulator [Pusillimonas sp.]HUH87435.1 LysR family transcriptional regulator [Pusillimonas sp.]